MKFDPDILNGLTAFCVRHFEGIPKNLTRLTGGANMEIYAFECTEQNLILRRYPGGVPTQMEAEAITLEVEAKIIGLAKKADVKAPNVVGVLKPTDTLGQGFVMTCELGEALPHKLLRDEKYSDALPKLTSEFARELAKIHAIDFSDVSDHLSNKSASDSVASIKSVLSELGAQNPIYAYAIRWLEQNIPPSVPACLLHGDFRMGNVLIIPEGLSAVLDWELAHIGDPAEDLAWLCVPSWRFRRYENPVAGVGQIEDLLSEYVSAGGSEISSERFKFWLVYGTLRWGMMTLMMMDMWRKGQDRAMERALIGTRCSEVEIDLLLLLENNVEAPDVDFDMPDFEPNSAEPETPELIQAVMGWMQTDLFAREKGRDLFNARVAANALSIVGRQTEFGALFERRANDRLKALGLSEVDLFDGLSSGHINLKTPGVLSHLRLLSLERLSLHQPKYAGLKAAKKKWNVG